MQRQNLLVTGPPRCGKSTLIENLLQRSRKPATGFFTREISEKGRRRGFSIITLDGRRGLLAHENIKSALRVARYGVNIEDIDRIAVPAMIPTRPGEVVVIDEIGKMECLSPRFRQTLLEVLASEHPIVGTIALKGDPFIEEIKRRDDVLLIHLSEATRESVLEFLLQRMQDAQEK